MLELGSSGSVRGVSSNGHPYRDPRSKAASEPDTQRTSLAIGAVPSAVEPKMISHERKSAGCRAKQLRSEATKF